MEWIRDRAYDYKVFKCSEIFEEYVYTIMIYVEEIASKSVKFHIGVSSGKKRKHREVFEEKAYKSKGGLKALMWLKDKMLEFPVYYDSSVKNQYICIGWSDSRRRDIYKRLKKYGFMFSFDSGEKILMKKL